MISGSKFRERASEMVRTSVVIFAFRTAAAWLYFNLVHGLFGRFFTSYAKWEQCLDDSLTGSLVGAHPGKQTPVRRLRRRVALAFENSMILDWLNRVGGHLLGAGMRSYSTMSLAFGLYTVLAALLRHVITGEPVSYTNFAVGVIVAAVSIPLMFVVTPLCQVLRESPVTRTIFIRLLRIPEDKFYPRDSYVSARYGLALVFGMLFGGLTYFVSPLKIIIALVLAIVTCVVMSLPEAGMVLLLAAFPFVSVFPHPTALLAGGVTLVWVGYAVKYLRGKRTLKMGPISVFVSLFALAILLGGVFTMGGTESFNSALMYFILIQSFNLIVNLIRTQDDCRHAIMVVSVSGAFAAVYGVIQYLLGFAASGWVDTEMFSYIEGRATSFFDNPNVLGCYLIMLIPMMNVLLIYLKGWKSKALSLFALVVTTLCTVWTWSRGAWLGVIVGVILFYLILSYRTLAVLLAGGLCLPVVGVMLPGDVMSRFLSIGNMNDSSTYFRVYTWKGVSRMLRQVWFSGIGVGQAAFEQVYPLFAYAGIEATPHAHNLAMEVLTELGISGLVMLIVIMVLFAQNCFTFIRNANGQQRMTVAAGLCGIVAALVMGLADNIWYNYRVFFGFWALIALTVAYINAHRINGDFMHERMSPNSAEISLNIMD